MSGTPTQTGLDVGDVGIDQAGLPPEVPEGVPGDPALRRPLGRPAQERRGGEVAGGSGGVIDLDGWFDEGLRGRPIELEIGSGKGTFILNQAKAMPGVNFVGIEYARAFWRYAADRVRRHGVRNVKLVHTEAGGFLRDHVGDGVFRQVHIYFPDPWPKKRHHKRRLVQEGFLREVWRVLVGAMPAEAGTPGRVRIATDHAGYFEWMEEHAARVADLFERVPFESPEAAGEGELVGSNFERKYRREGRSFYGMVLVKRVAV